MATVAELIDVPDGLAGVAVAATEIGDVVGEEGLYHYRGQSAPELARSSTFEDVTQLVLGGAGQLDAGDRALPDAVVDLVDAVDIRTAMSAAGAAIGCRSLTEIEPAERLVDATRLIALLPTVIASVHHGRPVEPDPGVGHVANYLQMLHGAEPTPDQVTALEAWFVLMIDHGFSNSAFATRVVASAGADLGACVLAGYGSLSGPRHGANLERMLDMFDTIGEPENAEDWLRNEIVNRRRLQGFGHSVYRKTDPRLELMREHGSNVAPQYHRLAMAVEEAGTKLLAGKRLVPNVDLHSAVVLEGCGVPRSLHTATFAAARIVGWCAHALEQAMEAKITRPAAHYIGPPPQ